MDTKDIKVVVVDDSALMRQLIGSILSDAPGIEVVGTARDPYVARELIKKTNPDVVTLDVEMPKMNGLAFLEKIMTLRPMPVVMISSLTQEDADVTFRALELGAVDYVAKPSSNSAELREQGAEIIEKVKAAARVNVSRIGVQAAKPVHHEQRQRSSGVAPSMKLIAIGASTGGVEALRFLFSHLPASMPPIVVAQHMPANFVPGFAKRLDGLSALTVKKADDGEIMLPGHVYIAGDDRHLEVHASGSSLFCRYSDGPKVSGHKPSVDALFSSIPQKVAVKALSIILTGMGKDGARGMMDLRKNGAMTLGQDETTCLVYGMPKVAFELGAVEHQLKLEDMPDRIVEIAGM